MLRDTGSLKSVITEDCWRKCNYSIFNNSSLVKGITDETIRAPLVQVILRSDLANGNVVVAVHNNIPSHFDILLGNYLVNPNSPFCFKDDILVVTRAQYTVFKQNVNVVQKNDAHLDHVVDPIFYVGE